MRRLNDTQLLIRLTALLLFICSCAQAGFDIPSAPRFESNSRYRATNGSNCEVKTSMAAVQFGLAGSEERSDDQASSLHTNKNNKSDDLGLYAQISIPLDLGGGRKPDCSHFLDLMERDAELDLQLKELEVQLKIEKLKLMKSHINTNSFSE